MISVFISSKNRPAQLRLLLESIQRNWKTDLKYHVRVTATEKLYADGYEKLLHEDPITQDLDGVFVCEPDFVKDFYYFLNNAEDVCAFFCDDCIVYRNVDCTNLENYLYDPYIWSFSLRLGLNTTVMDYKTGSTQSHLSTVAAIDNNVIRYPFKLYKSTENYGLPFSWDGHVYNTKGLLEFFDNTDFQSVDNLWSIPPQWIENYAMNRREKILQNYMMCQPQSSVICMNWNTTHRFTKDTTRFDGSKETMCTRYLNGEVIDMDSIDFSNVVSVHEEFPFNYKKL
jgi:hypothetical protein